ncbi:MAG TPA: PKD domain-containing protein [Vicinamibacterales bacterium]
MAMLSSPPVMSTARIGPMAVTFPPNNEPYDFRLRLEGFYQNTLRAGTSQTYVNLEGGGVWISEYIRYRVFLCTHNYAVSSVMTQIDTLRGTIPAACGEPPAGTVSFPPRNEPADFRVQLENKYRDGLRASPTSSFVNLEGDIVWMQQYFLYRLNGCDHEQASSKTLVNIQTGQVQSFCATAPPPPPSARVTVFIDGPSGFVNSNRDVSYSGLRSTSTAGNIVRYQWNCGASNVVNCNSTSPTPTFNYPKQGRLGTAVVYVVTLTVTDSAGNSASTSVNQNVTQVY